ncbi:MAG: hypothetical protein BGO60_13780 [Thiobacillus sp. 65-1059]|nr:MAG: hypothetical protein BGO60_13780 [Thiobacillus sp. 65-1059]
MRTTMQHLNDEHMQLYEWSGAGIASAIPAGSKRSHPWHASYGVLAVLTSLLILNGCDNAGTAERAGEQVDQAAQALKDGAEPRVDAAAEESGRAPDDAGGRADGKPE